MGSGANAAHREQWNKGRIVGQKVPFKPKDIWIVRTVAARWRGRRAATTRRAGLRTPLLLFLQFLLLTLSLHFQTLGPRICFVARRAFPARTIGILLPRLRECIRAAAQRDHRQQGKAKVPNDPSRKRFHVAILASAGRSHHTQRGQKEWPSACPAVLD